MRNRRPALIFFAASFAVTGTLSMALFAQQQAPSPKVKLTATDLLPLTCAQAWVKSGKSYPTMLAIVKVLARVSLANRDLTFPDTREAGLEAGKRIAEDCKADPNGLLFAFVDKHVRQAVEAASSDESPAQGTTDPK